MPERARRPDPQQKQRPVPGPDNDQFDPFEDVDDIIDEERDTGDKNNRDGQ